MRQTGNRLLRTNYVVLGDGQSEQYYLKHLKKLKNYKYAIRPSLFASLTIESAEVIIDELLSGGCDQIIYFTDYDTIVSQGKQQQFTDFKNKYGNRSEVFICESMPSIEFWFLLHFLKTTREFRNADKVLCELVKYIKGFSKEKSFLEKEKWVIELCKNGKLETALNNASSILKQRESDEIGEYFPFTKVHLAIQKFNEQMK
jgi:hypothetical protein